MGAGTAKFKSLTALGEGHVAMLLDRGSIPLASTKEKDSYFHGLHENSFFIL